MILSIVTSSSGWAGRPVLARVLPTPGSLAVIRENQVPSRPQRSRKNPRCPGSCSTKRRGCLSRAVIGRPARPAAWGLAPPSPPGDRSGVCLVGEERSPPCSWPVSGQRGSAEGPREGLKVAGMPKTQSQQHFYLNHDFTPGTDLILYLGF